MLRPTGHIFALALALLVLSPACVRAERKVDRPSMLAQMEKRAIPGPIEPGFRGQAYAVSAHAVAGEDDRSFETPIGKLSNRRVLAAAAVSFLCLLLFIRVPLAAGWTIPRLALRFGGPFLVFIAALLVLAG